LRIRIFCVGGLESKQVSKKRFLKKARKNFYLLGALGPGVPLNGSYRSRLKALPDPTPPANKSFLVLFFKKELLSSFLKYPHDMTDLRAGLGTFLMWARL